MNIPDEQGGKNRDRQQHDLDKWLDSIGWGLFFILLGSIWLMPEGLVPEGTFSLGLGVIILALNIIRYYYNRKIDNFWIVIGIILLVIGLGDFYGLELPLIPILIILIGIRMIVKPLLGKK